MNFLANWKPDLITAAITAFVLPLLYLLRRIIIKHIKDWTSYAIEGIMYFFGRTIRHSLAAALTLKRYCRLQLGDEKYKFLHVPSRIEINVDIDRVFVTLTLDHPGGKKSSYSHLDLLTLGNRIRVIGDPGSGKSSLVKRLFRDACQHAIRSPTKSRLPMLLEIKNLEPPVGIEDDELDTWLYEYLRCEAERSAVYKMADCFDNYAQTTGLLILLDGLDEVSSRLYPEVQTALTGLSKRLSQLSNKNLILITMRTQFHQQVKTAFREDFPHATFLKPLTPTDIYEFLTRWHFTKSAEKNISRIFKELTDRPTLREMCSNPLILSMYVAEDQAAGSVVAPESRTEFYSKVTEELIVKRRLFQRAQSTLAPTKLREQRERILGKLAFDHLLTPDQPANSLKWAEALKITKEVLNCDDQEAPYKFRELAKETGIVTEEKPEESLRFIHLTFCEFLAANEAVQGREDGWFTLIDAHSRFQGSTEPQMRSRLIEVIPFAAGLLPRIQRYNALNDVHRLGDSRLLARCFLETKLYDHPSWPNFIVGESQSLLNTPEQNWNEQWLRDLHLFNVVVGDANQCASHIPTTETPIDLQDFFQSLVARQKESLSKLLSAYASQDAAAAFRLAEVCNLDLAVDFPDIVVTNCDQAPFFALIRERMLHEPNRIELWASLMCESALQSRAVANLMHNLEPLEALSEYVEKVPKTQSWFHAKFIKRSLYTQCLTIAVSKDYDRNMGVTILALFRHIKAPGSVKWVIIRWKRIHLLITTLLFPASALMLCAYIFRPFLISLQQDLRIYAITSSALIMYSVFLISLYLRRRGIRVRRAYEAILQIQPSSRELYIVNGRVPGVEVLGKNSSEIMKNIIQMRKSALRH